MSQAEVATVPPDHEAKSRQVADDLDQQHPDWLVLWGPFTHEFVAFPLFHSGRRIILHTADPQELVTRMQQVEARVERWRTRQPRAYPDLLPAKLATASLAGQRPALPAVRTVISPIGCFSYRIPPSWCSGR